MVGSGGAVVLRYKAALDLIQMDLGAEGVKYFIARVPPY